MQRASLFVVAILFSFFLYSQDTLQDSLKEQARQYRQEGYKLQSQGDLKEALVYYKKAAELDPQYVEVFNDLGVVYESLGKSDKALMMYKKALEIDSNYLPAYTNLAFLYEKKGKTEEASYYWEKRYELGKEGEYWREVACQHLLMLGIYPRIRKKMLKRKAVQFLQELVYRREQQRLKKIEEAKLHFDIGVSLFNKGEYKQAEKECATTLSLNPQDVQLKNKIESFYKKNKKKNLKEELTGYIEEALDYVENDDFLSAGEKLKKALSVVFSLHPEENK